MSYAPSRRFSTAESKASWNGTAEAREVGVAAAEAVFHAGVYRPLDSDLLKVISDSVGAAVFSQLDEFPGCGLMALDAACKLVEKDSRHLDQTDRTTLGHYSQTDIANVLSRSIPILEKLAKSAKDSDRGDSYRERVTECKQALEASRKLGRK